FTVKLTPSTACTQATVRCKIPPRTGKCLTRSFTTTRSFSACPFPAGAVLLGVMLPVSRIFSLRCLLPIERTNLRPLKRAGVLYVPHGSGKASSALSAREARCRAWVPPHYRCSVHIEPTPDSEVQIYSPQAGRSDLEPSPG